MPAPTQRSPSEDTWRIFHIMSEFVEGIDVMSRVGAAVSVFGSARTPAENPYYQKAIELGRKFAQHGLGVITGGGPGIMEAANRGAAEAGGQSVGLNISLPMEQRANIYQNVTVNFHYFFIRKVMFVRYAVGFVCFPGGFGTMDEFFESMTLIQTRKTHPFPVVLYGSDFWKPLVHWLRTVMLEQHQNISPADLDLFVVTDDLDEAVSRIVTPYELRLTAAREPGAEGLAAAPAERMTLEGTVYGVSPQVWRVDRPQGW